MNEVPTEPELETVVEDFAAACRRGESPRVSAWIEKFPGHAEKLREILPAVWLLEHERPK